MICQLSCVNSKKNRLIKHNGLHLILFSDTLQAYTVTTGKAMTVEINIVTHEASPTIAQKESWVHAMQLNLQEGDQKLDRLKSQRNDLIREIEKQSSTQEELKSKINTLIEEIELEKFKQRAVTRYAYRTYNSQGKPTGWLYAFNRGKEVGTTRSDFNCCKQWKTEGGAKKSFEYYNNRWKRYSQGGYLKIEILIY